MEENFNIIQLFWQKVGMDGTIGRLCGLMDGPVKGILGISTCNEGEVWKYFVAVASGRAAENGLEKFDVPVATRAIFPPRAIPQTSPSWKSAS